MGAMSLRVAEALSRDVGRGVVRIDARDMAGLNVSAGDVIRLAGKRESVAKVLPAYADSSAKGSMQMNGILRENTQTAIGEWVTVEKLKASPAKVVLLAPLASTRTTPVQSDLRYVARVLDGLAVTEGDKVRATFLGGLNREFIVATTDPHGPVVIHANTTVKIKGESAEQPGREHTGVTYEDIGGLRKEIVRIREMVGLPLRYSELFDRLGIEPPKGVLLFGPPGTGKTLIAKAVANETSAYFTTISGPEIIGRYYGESEERLRRIFEEAEAHAPAILFIDEIDAIAPKREEMGSHQQVERRVVAQLLALLDGLQTRGQIVIIGATNVPSTLDPALRRPGRLDREITVGVPDRQGRLEILNVHTRGMPLSEGVDLGKLAELTYGFVGADLAALCREAAMATLRELMPEVRADLEFVPSDLLDRLKVRAEHFMEALKEVEPSAIREVFTEMPNVRWDDVGGLDDAKRLLREAVEWPLRYPEVFARINTRPPKGHVARGAHRHWQDAARARRRHGNARQFHRRERPRAAFQMSGRVGAGGARSVSQGQAGEPVHYLLRRDRPLAPRRGAGGEHNVADRVISRLLTELDGIEELKGVVVLAATNRADALDPALLRSGRLELRIDLPPPGRVEREAILRIHTRGKPLAADVDLAALAGKTDGFGGADIEALCRRAAFNAAREHIAGGQEAPVTIRERHFDEAIAAFKRSSR